VHSIGIVGNNEKEGGEVMDWKAEAKEKLRRYGAMQNALLSIPQEIKRLEIEYQSIRSSRTDGTPVKGGGSGREDALLNNLVNRQELEWALKQAVRWKQVTDQALSILDEEERLILRMLYISPSNGSMATLCKELGCEKSSVYNKRDKALHTFTIALYGAIET
jgi:hypothetical protein